jgi:hypothetical protein
MSFGGWDAILAVVMNAREAITKKPPTNDFFIIIL